MQDKPLALIIDDEADLCRLMQITLTKMGVNTHVAYDVATAKDFLAKNQYDFCLTDLALPDGSGMEIVELVTNTTETPVAVITAHGDVNIAIEAMKIGAFDFVNKPLELPRLRQLVQSALKVNKSNDNVTSDSPSADSASIEPKSTVESSRTKPKSSLAEEPSKPNLSLASNPTHAPQKTTEDQIFESRLIGDSRPMKLLRSTIKKLARSQAPVFLWGGSGTGKEVVSRLIHDMSPRRDGSFVPVNCGAIPSELMESEFFGHKKGSFTGATSDKIGLFQQADGGTLFLDEVADLPLAMQVKLLRAIQEKTVRVIGDTKEVPVDIRIVCATHKDLADLVQKGAFRQDLFYRINVIEVKLPALNERREDIPVLATHFLNLIAKDWELDNLSLTDDAIDALTYHNFKGNVRELRNILERAVTLSDSDVIDARHLMLDESDDSYLDADMSQTGMGTSSLINENSIQDNTILSSKTQNGNQASATASPNDTKSSPYYNTIPVYASPVIKETKPVQKPGIQIAAAANYGTLSTQNKTESKNPMLNESSGVQKPTAMESTILDSKIGTDGYDSVELPKEGLEAYLLEQEKHFITVALQQAGGNKTNAAKLLGMTFRSLRYRMKKLELEPDDGNDED